MKGIINKVKNKLHAQVFWHSIYGEYCNSWYGLRIFSKYSFKENIFKSKQNASASLTKEYHIVEKGMSLPAPRLSFGKEKIIKLIEHSKRYMKLYGRDELIDAIHSSLKEYLSFNKLHDIDLNADFFPVITDFINGADNCTQGGTKYITKEEINVAINFDYEKFIKSRSSIRDFAPQEVSDHDIEVAVNLARFTPSVCNRQAWKAHLFSQKEDVLRVLAFQNGHGGYKESINKVIIISTDVQMFTRLESNQVFIDGGLFAMNVINALHAIGLGSCPLNMCIPYNEERKLKKVAGISESERVIMMIAIGHLKEKFKVARSLRKNINSVLIRH